jgi:phosphoglycolate phosphatase
MKQLVDQLTAKYVIFDLDGTLIDSATAILWSLRVACKECSIRPLESLKSSLIGPPLMDILATVAGPKNAGALESLAAAFKNHYDNHSYKKTIGFAGASQLLRSLRSSGKHLYIATNKREVPTKKIIEHLGWGNYFQGVYCLDSFAPPLSAKPTLLEKLIDFEQLSTDQTVYVGDREEDALSAKMNSIWFIYASWGYG